MKSGISIRLMKFRIGEFVFRGQRMQTGREVHVYSDDPEIYMLINRRVCVQANQKSILQTTDRCTSIFNR